MNTNESTQSTITSADADNANTQIVPAKSTVASTSPAVQFRARTKVKRLRSDSTWHRLKPEQRKVINRWLHEDGLAYREICKRAQEELGLALTLSAVSRFYHQGLATQVVDELADAQAAAEAVKNSAANAAELRKSAMQVVHLRFLQKSMANADTHDVWALGRLALEGEQREIQRERVALAREKFEFNASQAAMKALPLARQFSKEDMEREEERMASLRRKLFGKMADEVLL